MIWDHLLIRTIFETGSANDPRQVIKLCPTCNEDILDSEEMKLNHGHNGSICNNERSQKRQSGQREQWNALCTKLTRLVVSSSQINSKFCNADHCSYARILSLVDEDQGNIPALASPSITTLDPSTSAQTPTQPFVESMYEEQSGNNLRPTKAHSDVRIQP